MKKRKAEKILLATSVITILTLALYLNQIYLTSKTNRQSNIPKVVLGTETTVNPYTEDLIALRKYISQYPKYFPGWIELAKLEAESGNFEAFLAALKKAENLNPNANEVRELKLKYGL